MGLISNRLLNSVQISSTTFATELKLKVRLVVTAPAIETDDLTPDEIIIGYALALALKAEPTILAQIEMEAIEAWKIKSNSTTTKSYSNGG